MELECDFFFFFFSFFFLIKNNLNTRSNESSHPDTVIIEFFPEYREKYFHWHPVCVDCGISKLKYAPYQTCI